MKTNWTRKMVVVVMSLALGMMFFSANGRADDFPTALAKTISQIPDGADVLSMGNANTSLTSDYSTRNPGAVDASDFVPRSKVGFSASYGNIAFKHGPDINLYVVSGAVRFPIGTLQLSYADGGSNNAKVDEFGDTLKFNEFPSIDAQYGLRVGSGILRSDDDMYAGIGYAHSKSKLTSRQFVGTPATTFVFDIASETTSNIAEFGVLYRIAKKVNLGAMYLHTWDSSDESVNGFTETTHLKTDQLRLGASVKITSLTLVAFDYHHLYLPNGKHDDQYFAGFEQFLIKGKVALYGGWANGGLTTGIGVYTPFGGLNVGYAHRPFRATEEFLGKADMLMVSVFGMF